MKKITLFWVLLFLSIYCYSQFGRTESPYDFDMTQPIQSEELIFEDSLIKIDFSVEHKYVGFILQNKTSKPIKVDWQNASIIIDGESQRIFHEGIKYINRNEIQPPTTVPPKAKLSDLLMPTDNVSYTSGSYGGWKERPLFPAVGKSKIEQMKGKELGIYIPIIMGEKTQDYSFNLVLTGFKKIDESIKEKPSRDDIYK